MTAGRSIKGTAKRRAPPVYLLGPLSLTEQQRVELAHRAWCVRSDLLALARVAPAWAPRLLGHVRFAVELADLLLPEPAQRDGDT